MSSTTHNVQGHGVMSNLSTKGIGSCEEHKQVQVNKSLLIHGEYVILLIHPEIPKEYCNKIHSNVG